MSTQDGYNDVSQAARDSLPTPSDSAMTAERLAEIYEAWCDSTFTLDLQPLGFDHIKQGAAMLRRPHRRPHQTRSRPRTGE